MDEQGTDTTAARGVGRRELLVAGGAAAVAAAGTTVLGAAPAGAEPLVPVLFPVDPMRLYDSRDLLDAGRLSNGFTDTLVNDPTSALGYLLNVTVVNTSGYGWLSVFSADLESTDASTINWYGPNQTMVNTAYTLIKADDAGIRVSCGGDGSTHYVLDLTAVLFLYDAGGPPANLAAATGETARGRHRATRS